MPSENHLSNFNKPYNSMHKDYFQQFPQNFTKTNLVEELCRANFDDGIMVKSPSGFNMTTFSKDLNICSDSRFKDVCRKNGVSAMTLTP
jgi:hypothetical protein